jgi:DNA-binding protein
MYEHEIDFTKSVGDRGKEISKSMDEYIEYIVRASFLYACAVKVVDTDGNFKFRVGEWKVKSSNWMGPGSYYHFILKYKRACLLDCIFKFERAADTTIIVVKKSFTFIDVKNLFYITEFVTATDKSLTEMSIMISKVMTS